MQAGKVAGKGGAAGKGGGKARVRNRIVGVIRFSYIALTGFARTPPDPGAARSMLFADDRLNRRFALFETLTLPSLRAQADGDFETLVVTSPDLPRAARDRLDAAVGRLPGGRVVTLEPMPNHAAMRTALTLAEQPHDTHLTGFRLDDDDAVDRAFVGRLRRLTDRLLPVCGDDRPFVTGFNRGFYLDIGGQANRLYEVVEKLPLGAGLAMTAPAGSRVNIFRRNHRLVAQYFPTFTDSDTPTFLRTVHRDNDSGAETTGIRLETPPADLARAVAGAFPFTLDELMRIGPDGTPRPLAGQGGT